MMPIKLKILNTDLKPLFKDELATFNGRAAEQVARLHLGQLHRRIIRQRIDKKANLRAILAKRINPAHAHQLHGINKVAQRQCRPGAAVRCIGNQC